MGGSVDPSLWTVRPAFGSVGGPDVHALTDEGLALAFTVGARVRRGAPSEALLALSVAGGAGALSERAGGARIRPTALGRFDQIAWGYLTNAGLVESVGRDEIRLTDAGRVAIEAGHAERIALLERVRRNHPLRCTWILASGERCNATATNGDVCCPCEDARDKRRD